MNTSHVFTCFTRIHMTGIKNTEPQEPVTQPEGVCVGTVAFGTV